MSQEEIAQEVHSDRAMNHAIRGFFRGSARWTVYGLLASGCAWGISNTYRRLTLAGKGFILMAFTLNGGMFHGERELQRYERTVKLSDGVERRKIYKELSKRGRIPSEGEVRKYKAEMAQKREAEAARQAQEEESQ